MIENFDVDINKINKDNPNYILYEFNGEIRSVENKQKKDAVDAEILIKKVERSGIPYRYAQLELKDLKVSKEILNQAFLYIKLFKPKAFHNLYLEGIHSTGKTSVACCIAKELIKQGYKVKFLYASQLSNILRDYAGYGKNSEDAKFELDNLKTMDFIYVDDMFDINKDIVYKSSNLSGTWDGWLREMLDSGMNMEFTSNTAMKNVHENYGKSIQELIDRNFHYKISFSESIKNTIILDKKNEIVNKMQNS